MMVVMIWPALITAGASLLGGFLSRKGQKDANVATRDLTREQMAFQERMSSTAYQRSMDDMRSAGLNPMLAYQQGGASSPGGASATMQNELEGGVASAMDALRLRKELKEVEARTSLTKDREWSQVQERAESRARQDQIQKDADLKLLQQKILTLQLPALENSARVEKGKTGAGLAQIERLRQALMGGRGFFNPIGR